MGKMKEIAQDFMESFGKNNDWTYDNIPSDPDELNRIKENKIMPHEYFNMTEKKYYYTGRIRAYPPAKHLRKENKWVKWN